MGEPGTQTEELTVLVNEAVKQTVAALPVPTAQQIEVLREVTVEVTRIVTQVITPTAEPTATLIPTLQPTAVPTPVIPDGWITYSFMNGNDEICYPSDWRIESEYPNGVIIRLQAGALVSIQGFSDVVFDSDDQKKIASLKHIVRDVFAVQDSVRFVDAYIIEEASFRPAMVITEAHVQSTDGQQTAVSTYAESGNQTALIHSFVLTDAPSNGTELVQSVVDALQRMVLCYRTED